MATKKIIAAVLAVAIFAASGVAFANIGSSQTVSDTSPVAKTSQPAKAQTPAAAPTQQPTRQTSTNGPCTTTTTSDVDNTPPDTHNNTTTTTECHSSSGGSNSINITNDSSQNTSTGSVNYQDNTNTSQ